MTTMKTILFYDTETTGLPLFSEPSEDPRQPHIVQLAALLVDADSRKVLSTVDLIISPDNWVIPEEVTQIHGITNEVAQLAGISEELVTSIIFEMSLRADLRVGHNEKFDARIIRIASKRHTDGVWVEKATDCTMTLAKPIMKLPPTAKMRGGFKNPTLSEAYKHFTGKELEGAHSAMADARACMDVYFAIQDLKRG